MRTGMQHGEVTATLAKKPTGIPGLDEALRGGLPAGRATVLYGGPGCGKTVLALQALVNGARLFGERGVFVAFEESARRIQDNAAAFGWGLDLLLKRQLFFLDANLRPETVGAGAFDLGALLAGLTAKVRQMGASRVVFDGIDMLLSRLGDPQAERTEVHRLHDWVLGEGLTGIFTAKADPGDPLSQARYADAAYMADCALLLGRRQQKGVSERALTILKYRGSPFSENSVPFVIGGSGLQVAEFHAAPRVTTGRSARLSTGVARLDGMLQGGYLRGSTVLITGLPGTAKSCLAGAFVDAACRRGERTLFVTIDEDPVGAIRNLTSVGIRLQPHVDAGRLRMLGTLSLADSAEVQLLHICAAIREHRAGAVVVDSLTAMARASEASTALPVLARFVKWCKEGGITFLGTALVASPLVGAEATDLAISTLSDTCIHLSYAERGGERNRALTILKSRGTRHSNQVRELILSDSGIALSDVYEMGGEVFMGTMRWEQEQARHEEERRLRQEATHRRVELEKTSAELAARREALEREIALNQLELSASTRGEADRQQRARSFQRDLGRQRGADGGTPARRATARTVARRRRVRH